MDNAKGDPVLSCGYEVLSKGLCTLCQSPLNLLAACDHKLLTTGCDNPAGHTTAILVW